MSHFRCVWNEDGDATVLGRITARDGSGSATGISGEGKFLQQADISTISRKIFDLSSATPDTAVSTTSLTVSDVVVDTPVTATTIWTGDSVGYNFINDVAASNFPTGNNIYRVEYVVTLTGGAVFHGSFTGPAQPYRTG